MTDYPVFTTQGDARAEVREIIDGIQSGSATDEGVGLHKLMFVERARMTIVMVRDRDTPLARTLRQRAGWSEPREG